MSFGQKVNEHPFLVNDASSDALDSGTVINYDSNVFIIKM
jgi:hypothetical protein